MAKKKRQLFADKSGKISPKAAFTCEQHTTKKGKKGIMKKRLKIVMRVSVRPQTLQEEREFNQRRHLFLVEIVRQILSSRKELL